MLPTVENWLSLLFLVCFFSVFRFICVCIFWFLSRFYVHIIYLLLTLHIILYAKLKEDFIVGVLVNHFLRTFTIHSSSSKIIDKCDCCSLSFVPSIYAPEIFFSEKILHFLHLSWNNGKYRSTSFFYSFSAY